LTGWLRNVFGADKANDAQVLAGQQAEAGYEEALNYLKEREALPIELRDQALQGLAGFYQVPGQAKTQEQLIAEAQQSPLYGAITGNIASAEDAIRRNASATGGLRSGGTSGTIGRYVTDVKNKALLESFNQLQGREDYMRGLNLSGLSGLAGLSGNEGAIAQLTTGIGENRANTTLGQANTQTSALNNAFSTLLGLGSVGAQAGMFSDLRLKKNIRYMGEKAGFPWYRWEWNEIGNELGLEGEDCGVIAHHVYEKFPEAVGLRDGFLTIDYSKLEIH
jgi:hypothetical protein